MKRLIVIFVLFSICCSATKEFERASLHYWNELEKKKYVMRIPSGFSLTVNKADGEAGIQKQFKYADSSIIYMSNYGESPNANNLRRNGRPSNSIEKESMQLVNQNDTLVHEGQDEGGLFWKEITIGNVEIGYLNSSKDRKKIYDMSLNTLKNR